MKALWLINVALITVVLAMGFRLRATALSLETERAAADSSAVGAEMARLTDKASQLKNEVATHAARIAALEAGRSGAKVGPAASDASAETGALSKPRPSSALTSRQQMFREAFDDPAFRRRIGELQKSRMHLFYGEIFEQLRLNPEERERLTELLVDAQQARGDGFRAAVASGIDPYAQPESIKKGVIRAQSEALKEIETMLGPDRYRSFREYETTFAERATVERLRRSLSYSLEPLTPEQSRHLARVLSETGSTSNRPYRHGPGPQIVAGLRPPDAPAAISDAAVQQATTILTPIQLQALRRLQEAQRAERTLRTTQNTR